MRADGARRDGYTVAEDLDGYPLELTFTTQRLPEKPGTGQEEKLFDVSSDAPYTSMALILVNRKIGCLKCLNGTPAIDLFLMMAR
jgi:hypothetical protein